MKCKEDCFGFFYVHPNKEKHAPEHFCKYTGMEQKGEMKILNGFIKLILKLFRNKLA